MVTGAAGCIGSCLTRRLLSLGEPVVAFDKDFTSSELLSNKSENLEIAAGDLSQKELLLSITKDVDIVYHLAAKVHEVPKNKEEELEFFKVNVEGTRILLDTCVANGISKFIFFSTVATFKEKNGAIINEHSPVKPVTAYSRSKLEAERLVINYQKKHSLIVVVLKLPVVYGPNDKGNVGRLIEAIAKRKFRIIGKGKNLKSMVYVENVTDAAILVAQTDKASGKAYIVADDSPYSLNEIAETIAAQLEIPLARVHVPKWSAYLLGALCDMTKKLVRIDLPLSRDSVKKLTMDTVFSPEAIKRELGYKPKFGLQEGMKITIDWYKSVKSDLESQ